MSPATVVSPAPTLGALVIDVDGRRASVASAELYLSEAEFKLLAALAAEPGRLFSREELQMEVFAGSPGASVPTIERYARRLGRKLELRGLEGWLRFEAGTRFRLEAVGNVDQLGATR
jgi:DNA-binding response OmpR family regulator